ncbi:MAG: hypothetical protein JSR49_05470 [Proteobacteria bacterium]|nr:hypothetical protein [Pseudomonadota bacterium]
MFYGFAEHAKPLFTATLQRWSKDGLKKDGEGIPRYRHHASDRFNGSVYCISTRAIWQLVHL